MTAPWSLHDHTQGKWLSACESCPLDNMQGRLWLWPGQADDCSKHRKEASSRKLSLLGLSFVPEMFSCWGSGLLTYSRNNCSVDSTAQRIGFLRKGRLLEIHTAQHTRLLFLMPGMFVSQHIGCFLSFLNFNPNFLTETFLLVLLVCTCLGSSLTETPCKKTALVLWCGCLLLGVSSGQARD